MKRSIWLLLILAASACKGLAAGLIIVHDPAAPEALPHPMPVPPERWYHPPQPVWAPLEVGFVQAKVRIKDQIASTSLEEEFYNPNPRPLEGTFLFPVPKGAHLDKFTMDI